MAAFAEQVDVVGVTPLPGAGVDRDRVPGIVSRIDGAELTERGASSFADALHERLGAVTLEGSTTNLFQPTLRFRGFTASPLLGLPQGIAVYQNGVRVNEPFGDTVQFDLLPQFAIQQAQLSAGADPAYGLNAMGGALALQLKDGFTHTGFRGEFSGGAFGRTQAVAEYGANNGAWAFYAGASHFAEEGWRDESPSRVTQAFADVGYRSRSVDAGVSFTYADTDLTGNAAGSDRAARRRPERDLHVPRRHREPAGVRPGPGERHRVRRLVRAGDRLLPRPRSGHAERRRGRVRPLRRRSPPARSAR